MVRTGADIFDIFFGFVKNLGLIKKIVIREFLEVCHKVLEQNICYLFSNTNGGLWKQVSLVKLISCGKLF